jgi:hypothetical protein
MTGIKAFLAGTAIVLCAAGAASANTLINVNPADLVSSDKLFRSEWKRDRNVNNNSQRGHDIFLRNGAIGDAGPSLGVDWGVSGTSYEWTLSYDSDGATLEFGTETLTIDVDPDGDWNAVEFFLRADASQFDTSTSTVNIETVNGHATGGFTRSVTDGQFSGIFALDGFGTISSLSGTMSFDFDVASGANESPNSRLAVNVKALQVAPIPVPPALALGALALGGLGLYGRRQRRAAKG